ncbi:MAG TPA: type VI secretion system-associated FHA domain protein, partial [Polyangiaceae bacterium]|nr:type VI secretion system-associated FHA domain protein [Polyangiaceae bacterium]
FRCAALDSQAMAVAFRVHYQAAAANIQGERVLFQLPIRFGRNALNHCQIVHGYISDFHAVVEYVDGQLCVRDLNSKNGVHLPSGQRIAPNVSVPLAGTNHAFVIGQLAHVHIDVFEQNRAPGERLQEARGSVLGNRAILDSEQNGWRAPPHGVDAGSLPGQPPPGDSLHELAPLPPLSADGDSRVQRPPMVPGGPNLPWGGASPGASPPSHGLPALAPLPPGYDPARSPNRLPQAGVSPQAQGVGLGTHQFTMGIETMALLGLRELAGSLVPGAALQTTGDVARLLTKLHDTVEIFCRCFVPLREGHAQFLSSLDLRRAASQRSLNRSASAVRVETARDPASLAAALLDWRNRDYDAPEVVEGIFADLMMHQMALIEGLMRGVQALIEELSPEKIERIFRDERPPGVSAILGRHRALWQTFKVHYEELTNETRTFELVFGPDFAASYREYLARRGKPTPQ